MKIVSISRVKNEMDIIETFVRYNLNIVDEMIIWDDNSSDKTLDILKSLENEGLPISIIENKTLKDQVEIINTLFKKALEKYDADIILPLDADEFIVGKTNPRKILEELDLNKYYHVLWKTYIPNLNTNLFSLESLEYIRDPKIEITSKIIIPSGICEKYDVKIEKGSHNIFNENNIIPNDSLDSLKIAHCPIRSKEQCISKIVTGWLNNITNFYKKPLHSWHQKKLFQLILEKNGQLTNDDLIEFTKEFSSHNASKDISLKYDPFDLSFCKNIQLRYTNNIKVQDYTNILENSENISVNYALTKQKLNDINEIILNNDKSLNENYLNLLEESYSFMKKRIYVLENELILNEKKHKQELYKLKQEMLDFKVSSNNKLDELNKLKDKRVKELYDYRNNQLKLKEENLKLSKQKSEYSNSLEKSKKEIIKLNKLLELK
ncbi:MAG: glycosyltransferase family 2 protein [Methanobacteriaceae archaeon]|nr:glycosyltransferase family 2 protein [Methanobacteriaceae archaeon]